MVKSYEFYDIFVKTCEYKDGIGECKKRRESKKCVDGECEVVKVPETKLDVLDDYYKQLPSEKQSGGDNKARKRKNSVVTKLVKSIEKKYECPICHKFKYKSSKDEHMAKHERFRCPICYQYFNRFTIQDHIAEHKSQEGNGKTSPKPTNKALYNYVKQLANKKFKSKSGIYRSSWIVKEYKKRGGRYSGKKNSSSGLKRWYKEKWVDLNRPIRNSKGKIIGYKSCGRKSVKGSKDKYPLCRPSRRVNKGTPRTYKNISSKSISKAKREKSRIKHKGNIKFGGGSQVGANLYSDCFNDCFNEIKEMFIKNVNNKIIKEKLDKINFLSSEQINELLFIAVKNANKKHVNTLLDKINGYSEMNFLDTPSHERYILDDTLFYIDNYSILEVIIDKTGEFDIKNNEQNYIVLYLLNASFSTKRKIKLIKKILEHSYWNAKLYNKILEIMKRFVKHKTIQSSLLKLKLSYHSIFDALITILTEQISNLRNKNENFSSLWQLREDLYNAKEYRDIFIFSKDELNVVESYIKNLKTVVIDDGKTIHITDTDEFDNILNKFMNEINSLPTLKDILQQKYKNKLQLLDSVMLITKKQKLDKDFMYNPQNKILATAHMSPSPKKDLQKGGYYGDQKLKKRLIRNLLLNRTCPVCLKIINGDMLEHIAQHRLPPKKRRISLENYIKDFKRRKEGQGGGSDVSCEMCQLGNGKTRSQYYGLKSKVMVKVPVNVKNVALYSFKLKKMGFGGGIETGWKRANQLAKRESIPIEDLKYMRAWFARHLYASYPSYKQWKKAGRPKDTKWHKKHGIISWLIWGGDPAFKWVNSQKNINLLNKHYNKSYKPLKLK